MSIRTAVLAERSPDQAILHEVERRKNNLVMLGAARRPGKKLFFGDTRRCYWKKSECSILFLAS